ncbi:hypothetical protein B5M10_05875 [Pluralibacter gergoviae]|uniref:5-oxoprolinase subunit C family protein n=1 Tax=Pluralibacter gergoviae TaxID=61647 RepID=UPI0005EC0118|nr:biotin-dependent carboxyltransferase family protein [Pluralibacter gergoviae]KJM65498.1 hypothetical protein SS31_06435 [Pluralibacter gergoviae]OUR03813.1 hypothetical protein B5M10_05875 [Pluralibacter gergoviae]
MIKIERCGPLTTIQDRGRTGYKRIGVGCAGPYDRLSYLCGQLLLRNHDLPAVEILFYPLRVSFTADMTVAVTGASGNIRLDDQVQLPWSRFSVQAGQTLVIHQPTPGRGIATYLGVAGGLSTDTILGSASADLKAKFAGFCGREIAAGDLLPVGDPCVALSELGINPQSLFDTDKSQIHFVPGFEFAHLKGADAGNVSASGWRISPRSNRIGVRLEGAPLAMRSAIELLSYGLVPGLIQLPPDGQPIVLMADAQTMGGYPRLGFIPESELSKLAQNDLGSTISLIPVSIASAEALAGKQNSKLDKLRAYAEIA